MCERGAGVHHQHRAQQEARDLENEGELRAEGSQESRAMAQSIDSRSLGGVRTPENKGEKSSRKLRRLQRSGGQVSPDLWRTTQPERERPTT